MDDMGDAINRERDCVRHSILRRGVSTQKRADREEYGTWTVEVVMLLPYLLKEQFILRP